MSAKLIITDKYHADRRRKILAKYPQLRKFMTVDPSFKYVALSCILTHIYISYCLRNSSLIHLISYALIVGTSFGCAISNALHETVHDLAFEDSILCNKIFANLLNCALIFPGVGEFYQSHKYHHACMGTEFDTKFPTTEEAYYYDNGLARRILFVLLHPFLLNLRWNKLNVRKTTTFVICNIATVLIFDAAILTIFGWKAFVYLSISAFINDTLLYGSKGYGDHTTLEADEGPGMQSNSYYGWLNYFNFNLGYHREHHDFPNIPGRYLPEVRRIAKEYYSDQRFIQKSTFSAIWNILTAQPYHGIMKHSSCLASKDEKPLNID